MSRTAIVATIVTSILAFSSPSIAASDEDLGHLGELVSAAFKCSTYAAESNDPKEEERLFQIGLKAARDFVEGMKNQMKYEEYRGGVSTDFVVGMMYKEQSDKADDEIRKYYREKPLVPGSDEAKNEAKLRYRDSNCSLIQ